MEINNKLEGETFGRKWHKQGEIIVQYNKT